VPVRGRVGLPGPAADYGREIGAEAPLRRRRRADPRIENIDTHPRSSVCLAVAAEFLGLDERTVRARIEDGRLPAWRDGKVYRIDLADLAEYDQERRQAS
jgi:excisionase family DNA binding protein